MTWNYGWSGGASIRKLVVTDLGRLFIRIIAMRFDEYLIAGEKGSIF